MMAQGTIMVIDDEPDVLDVLCDLLEMEGFSVACVNDPEHVYAQARQSDPSLFLIDIMMPGISGIEVAEELRTQGFACTPMIAMSASQRMVEVAESSGFFQESVNKPFDLDEVIGAIERYLARDGEPEVEFSPV